MTKQQRERINESNVAQALADQRLADIGDYAFYDCRVCELRHGARGCRVVGV